MYQSSLKEIIGIMIFHSLRNLQIKRIKTFPEINHFSLNQIENHKISLIHSINHLISRTPKNNG
jgi:competence protein ComGF